MRNRLVSLSLAGLLALSGSGTAEAQELGPEVRRHQNISLGDLIRMDPRMPRDIYRPSPRVGARHADLATFAWLEFIALNAPSTTTDRGVSDGSFEESGFFSGSDRPPLLWETLQHKVELFPYNDDIAIEPRPFNEFPPVYIYNDFTSSSQLLNNLDEASQIGQNTSFFPALDANEPDGQVLFQAKVNKIQSDYIRANFDNLVAPITLPNNALEIKTAWRLLDTIPVEERGRYVTSEASFYIGDDDDIGDVASNTYALIAMHIIQKTENYPTWIFATFEHVDVIENPDTGQASGYYYVPTYNQIAYSTPPSTVTNFPSATVKNPGTHFNVNRPRARPNGRPVALPLGAVTDIPGAVTVNGEVRIPVVQPPTVNRFVDQVNAEVLAAMQQIPGFDDSFIWQYYQLKGVQAVATNSVSSPDFYLADIAIESSQPGIQLWRGGNQLATNSDATVTTLTNPRNQVNVYDPVQDKFFAMGGCMGCHGVAATQVGHDFSFLIGATNGKGFTPQTVGTKDTLIMIQRAEDLNYLTP